MSLLLIKQIKIRIGNPVSFGGLFFHRKWNGKRIFVSDFNQVEDMKITSSKFDFFITILPNKWNNKHEVVQLKILDFLTFPACWSQAINQKYKETGVL